MNVAIDRKKVFDLMCKKELSTSALSRASGVSLPVLWGLTSGRHPKTRTNIIGKLAAALGVEPSDLVYWG